MRVISDESPVSKSLIGRSDSPELRRDSEGVIEEPVKKTLRYRRTIFRKDFRECARFVQFILKKRLCEKETDQSQLIRLAFETSLIISYCRPFGRNEDLPGDGTPSLKHAIGDVLDESEQELHKLLKTRRNQLYAHSQASAHVVPGFDYESSALQLMLIHERLTEPQLRLLQVVIKKWIAYLGR